MLANRVREYTNTEGTGDITLGGALKGHVRFSDAFAVADEVAYVVEDGDNYEIGTGTLAAANRLERTSVSETLLNGVFDRAAPEAIPLSGNARVFCALTSDYLNRPEVAADVIREVTEDAGVTVDGVTLKDGGATFSAGLLVETGGVEKLRVDGDTLTVSGKAKATVFEHPSIQMGDSGGGAWFAPLIAGVPDFNREFGFDPALDHWYARPGVDVAGKLSVGGGGKISVQNKVNGGPDHGIFWWDDDNANWGTYLAASNGGTSLADTSCAPALDGRAGLHLRHRAPVDPAYGFLWENSSDICLMSLSADQGDLSVAGNVYTAQGNAIKPAFAFAEEGLYRVDENSMGFSLGGAEKARMDGGGLQMANNANIRNGGGAETSPSYTFVGASDTGIFRRSVDQIGFSAGGVTRAVIGVNAGVTNASGLWVNNGSSVALVVGSDSTGPSLGDGTTKVGRIAVPHYIKAEEPLALFFALAQESENTVSVGGGSTIMNAASRVGFYTAMDSTTVSGTLRWQIGPSGDLSGGSGCDILKLMSNEGLYLSGGAAPNEGANLYLLGDAHPEDAFDFAVRRGASAVLHYDDDYAGGNGTFRFFKEVRLESSLAITSNIVKTLDTANLLLSGSSATNKGANLALYGDAHASRAYDIEFRSASSPELSYDHDVGVWHFYSNEIRNAAGIANAPVVRFENQSGTSPEVARFILSNSPMDQSATYLKCSDGSNDVFTIFADGGASLAGDLVTDGVLRGKSDSTVNRPSAVSVGAGAQMFDTTLGKPIWSDGSQWVDAAGAAA
ncbi:hypothetical protein [Kordiimonas aestuarii]|nr:hypothetical protein [Kordiimonas aestuarii]